MNGEDLVNEFAPPLLLVDRVDERLHEDLLDESDVLYEAKGVTTGSQKPTFLHNIRVDAQ